MRPRRAKLVVRTKFPWPVFGAALLLFLAGLTARGFFVPLRFSSASRADLLRVMALGLLVALLVHRLAERFSKKYLLGGTKLERMAKDAELSTLLVLALYVLFALTGGSDSPLYPLVYLLGSYIVAYQSTPVALLSLLTAVVLEVASVPSRELLLVHLGLLGLFSVMQLIFWRGPIWRGRLEMRARIADEVSKMRQEARDFRLISAALGPESRARGRDVEQEQLLQGSVDVIHQSLYYTLELLKKSLELHTCVLLWLDMSGERLKIKELVTDSDGVVEQDLPAHSGAIGACIKDRLLINLKSPAPRQVPYYRGREPVAAFVAVPVLEGTHLRGVLAADRLTGRPFEVHEEALLQGASLQVLRAIQAERIFVAIERSKYEKERFFRASERLNRALTLDQVYSVALGAAREIVAFDFAAITLYTAEGRGSQASLPTRSSPLPLSLNEKSVRLATDAEAGQNPASPVQDGAPDGPLGTTGTSGPAHRKRHLVAYVEGEGKLALEGIEFGDNAGLVSMVVKNRHYLPARGQQSDDDVPIFTKKQKGLRKYPSLLVLPLVCADEALGTLTLGGKAAGLFSKDKRDMLGVIAHQVAVSIENGKMYRRMEEMATTDGLTGLLNHRTFQERAERMLERSSRLGKPCTLILCDIDHFKSINDTYGHPVGDTVLRRVSQILARSARKIDLVARCGGEEFGLLLEQTDTSGAYGLAERIRQEIAKQSFASEKGSFQVTISLGLATHAAKAPRGGASDAVEAEQGEEFYAELKRELIEQADKALYAAKRGGRNRTVRHTDADSDERKEAKEGRKLKIPQMSSG